MVAPLGAGRLGGTLQWSQVTPRRPALAFARVGWAASRSQSCAAQEEHPRLGTTKPHGSKCFVAGRQRSALLRRALPQGTPGEPEPEGQGVAGMSGAASASPEVAHLGIGTTPSTTTSASSSEAGAVPVSPLPEASSAHAASSSRPPSSPSSAATPAASTSTQPPDLGQALHSLAESAMATGAAASAWVQALPMWAQSQQLRRVREAADDEPQDADRHALLLSELNKAGQYSEVLESVEGRQRNTASAAVAVQYLRALVASGRISEYVPPTPLSTPTPMSSASHLPATASPSTTASSLAPPVPLPDAAASSSTATTGTERPAAASAPSFLMTGTPPVGAWSPPAESSPSAGEHRSLYQLLGDLQAQVAGEQPDLSPGTSSRRPLHVFVQGMGAAPAAKPLGPLQVLWSLVRMVMLLVAVAFAWLIGNQAIRRAQMQTQAPQPSVSSVMPATSAASSGPAGTSVDPKEYKKEELPEKSVKTFADVRGCDEAKEELREVVEFLKNPTRFTRLGAKLPKGVLLTGPPGTGKTLLARAVAGEAGVPFFYRAGSEFEELYVGVGARRMRALFQAAKRKAPCIVFIDEIDAIGGNRKHWENNTRKTLNQLLVEMDGFDSNDGVIVLAATNLAETLDPALKRPGRFDRQVAVPLPDIKGRHDILAYYMKDKPMEKEVNTELLARQTQGFSGADISNLINEAALLAAKENKETISASALEYAYDKISMGVERKSARRTAEGVKRTAFHEGGHALVALCTPGASPVHKATVVPRGHALGMVTQVGREDEFSINRQQMLARIRVCMGGTVAEELVFGPDQVSSGASDDLRQATEMARYMVTRCGMNDVVGPQYLGGGGDDPRGGGSSMSEELRNRVDAEVRRMLVEAKDEVKALLTSRLQDLHAIATALIDRETLSREELEALISPGNGSGSATERVPGEHQPGDDRDGEEGGELVRSSMVAPPRLEFRLTRPAVRS